MDVEEQYAEFLESTDRWVMGMADADDFFIRFLATCRDPRSAQSIATLVTNLRDSCLKDLQKPHKDTIPDHLRIQELVGQMLKGLRVETRQTLVNVEPDRGVKLAELLPLIAKNGL